MRGFFVALQLLQFKTEHQKVQNEILYLYINIKIF